MDRIEIERLEVECIIGIRPHERRRAQRVVVDLALGLDLSLAGRNERIADTCDYDVVSRQVAELLRFRRYELMENAAEELAAMLFAIHRAVERVTLRIAKPAALVGRARSAAVCIERDRLAYTPRPVEFGGAIANVWLETRGAVLYTVAIHRERSFHPPTSWRQGERRCAGWLLSGTLLSPARHTTPPGELIHADLAREPTRTDSGAELFACVTPPP